MEPDVEIAIKRVMSDVLDLNPEAIHGDTSPGNTVKWDSANHVQLVMALEDEFSVVFDVAEFESMVSFTDIVRVVQSKL